MFEDTIRREALKNAIKFKGTANPKALVGAVIKEHPEAKDFMGDVSKTIATIVAEVNSLSLEDQKTELLKINPDFEKKQKEKKAERKEKRSSLPDLPNAEHGKVVTRIPPEPSKYNHMGHAMSFLINYLYAKKYAGKVILRFDDTNPEKSSQEFVDAVHEDVINFLEIKPDEIKYASDNMEKYYGFAEKLIEKGEAYVCSCPQEDIKLMRREGKDCIHRNQEVKENQKHWDKMKSGDLKEGSVVLRLKIDMEHKNAVMRDPVIYRLSYASHYKVGTKYKVWPMYDFETAIEEGLCGVTHVMRSNEFDSRIELQNYIANLLGFPEVTYKHYGRYNIVGATTQGREIRALIETRDYIGWDDPRLVTIRALRRRGIVKEAFYELAQSIGLSKTQTNLEFSVLAAVNRGILDRNAKRLYAIRDPVEILVSKIPKDIKSFSLAYHPEDDKGARQLIATEKYFIEKKDHDEVPVGGFLRLKDAMNIKKVSKTEYEFVSSAYDDYRAFSDKHGIVQFVPKTDDLENAELFMPDITTQKLICEPNIRDLKVGDVVQFERFAFCRLDDINEDGTRVFWFTHD